MKIEEAVNIIRSFTQILSFVEYPYIYEVQKIVEACMSLYTADSINYHDELVFAELSSLYGEDRICHIISSLRGISSPPLIIKSDGKEWFECCLTVLIMCQDFLDNNFDKYLLGKDKFGELVDKIKDIPNSRGEGDKLDESLEYYKAFMAAPLNYWKEEKICEEYGKKVSLCKRKRDDGEPLCDEKIKRIARKLTDATSVASAGIPSVNFFAGSRGPDL